MSTSATLVPYAHTPSRFDSSMASHEGTLRHVNRDAHRGCSNVLAVSWWQQRQAESSSQLQRSRAEYERRRAAGPDEVNIRRARRTQWVMAAFLLFGFTLAVAVGHLRTAAIGLVGLIIFLLLQLPPVQRWWIRRWL